MQSEPDASARLAIDKIEATRATIKSSSQGT
jgi:hypothetical protein